MTNNQGTWDMIAGHDEMAKAALYFNSDLAANLTGESIAVDAGGGLLPSYNTNPAR